MDEDGSIFEHWFAAVVPQTSQHARATWVSKWNRTYSWHGSCWLLGEGSELPATVPPLYAVRLISALMVRQNDIYSACSLTPVERHRCPPSHAPGLSGNLRPTYSEPLAYWLQAHQKATKAGSYSRAPGLRVEHRRERISTRRWREASSGSSSEGKQVNSGTRGQVAPSIWPAPRHSFWRHAWKCYVKQGKMQTGWI